MKPYRNVIINYHKILIPNYWDAGHNFKGYALKTIAFNNQSLNSPFLNIAQKVFTWIYKNWRSVQFNTINLSFRLSIYITYNMSCYRSQEMFLIIKCSK